MKIEINTENLTALFKKWQVWGHIKTCSVLIIGFIGMTIFDVAAGCVGSDDENKFIMFVGAVIAIGFFGQFRVMCDRLDANNEKACDKDNKAV